MMGMGVVLMVVGAAWAGLLLVAILVGRVLSRLDEDLDDDRDPYGWDW